MKHDLSIGIIPQLAVYLAALFCGCMLLLSLLHRSRPQPSRITLFYLMIALGGALGGIFVGIAAPLIFNDFWEFRIGLMIVCSVAAWFLYDKAWFSAWKIPLLVATVAVLALLSHMPNYKTLDVVSKSRTFYGAIKVTREKQPRGINVYALMHGKICHGLQFDSGPYSRRPTAYFGPQSGIGLAFANHPKTTTTDTDAFDQHKPMTVGVLGMGIGTVGAYAEEGDEFRFYELSPDVVRVATNTAYFRYLSECPAKTEIILGDARVSLEHELAKDGPHKFDILNMDAFNGDAIPVHLLTKQAFAVYLKHLEPKHGILAIQITNMYLDLRPVLAGLAKEYNLHGYVIKGTGDMRITSDCLWVLLSPDPNFRLTTTNGAKVTPLKTTGNYPLWTDDFSNIISIMKTKLLVKGRGPHTK